MNLSRRNFAMGVGATAIAAGATPASAATRETIDRRVSNKMQEMFNRFTFTQKLAQQAAGVLMIPRFTKGGIIIGGAYGEGSLLIGNAPVDYYSLAAGSYGIQLGAQQFSTALFLMNQEELTRFRRRDGWTVGVDLEAVALETGEIAAIDSNTYVDDVYALNFGQKGLMIGASIEGAKYSRIWR